MTSPPERHNTSRCLAEGADFDARRRRSTLYQLHQHVLLAAHELSMMALSAIAYAPDYRRPLQHAATFIKMPTARLKDGAQVPRRRFLLYRHRTFTGQLESQRRVGRCTDGTTRSASPPDFDDSQSHLYHARPESRTYERICSRRQPPPKARGASKAATRYYEVFHDLSAKLILRMLMRRCYRSTTMTSKVDRQERDEWLFNKFPGIDNISILR